MKLKGKVALITGASRGIGRGIAELFAEEGANVAVNYVANAKAAEDVAAYVRSKGQKAITVKADSSKRSEVEPMLERVWKELGPVDILVNNAGIETIVPFLELTDEQWTRLVDVNLRGPWLCSQVFCRKAVATKRKGVILNIGSVQAAKVLPGRTHYAPTKLGIEALTRNMSVEMMPNGIRVNCLHPGLIETDMTAWVMQNSEIRPAVLAQISMGRAGHIREMGTAAVFFCSDDSSYITGQSLHAEGGWIGEVMRDPDPLFRQGVLKLLAIKDSDIRMLTLEQSRTAVDKGLHAGGALSAVIPLVALYYGGFIDIDVEQPTRRGQDMFVLSKGHAVAALASIFAELGYFDPAVLRGSRSYESILNGHPGPVLPGVHVPTGPLGQGLGVAQGFALVGKGSPRFDTYCLAGDGELQEGLIWEAVMYSAHKRLDNLCLLVDKNNGQLDITDRLIFPLPDLDSVFRAFGWQTHNVDTTQYDGVHAALQDFKYGPRNGKPTVIICHTSKGYGGFSSFLNRHKVEVPEKVLDQEMALQAQQRQARIDEFAAFCSRLNATPEGKRRHEQLIEVAQRLRIHPAPQAAGFAGIVAALGPVRTRRAPGRDKQIRYNANELPRLDKTKTYAANDIITAAMKVFALDSRVVSVDADLASTSGLEAGIAAVAQNRALNVGVAEANMMNIGEAYAAMGYNAWVSTFCPFFDWKVLRRIAVGYQERLEAIADPGSWLSEGHGLDLTFLATAGNLETRTNGATHMGNDDNTVFDGIAHLKFIDVSCPQQLLGIMEWIMAGNRGLLYVRLMRAGSGVLYDAGFKFEFGRGYVLRQTADERAVILSSGRGVHEALAAAADCAKHGLNVGVVDLPSIDEGLLLELYDSGKHLCFAEQNNGYIWRNFRQLLFRQRGPIATDRLMAVNTLGPDAKPRFIHSGSYPQLLAAFGLAPQQLSETIRRKVNG